MTITTMHDSGNSFDPLFVSPDIYGSSGLNFAIVDDDVTPQAAMAERAMTVLPGWSTCFYGTLTFVQKT
jgi:Ethanolamine utilization protein EutJ (predicted chaperonin)